MKLNGHEVISRQTATSWRILVSFSAVVIAVGYFGYNDRDWPVLDRPIAPQHFKIITSVVLGFLGISYLVNWYGDLVGYSTWFKRNEVVKDDIFSSSSPTNTENPLDALGRRLRAISKSNGNASERVLDLEKISISDIQRVQGDRDVAADLELLRTTTRENSQALATIVHSLDSIKELLDDLRPNFRKVSWVAKFLVFGWYLAIPIGLVILAFFYSNP